MALYALFYYLFVQLSLLVPTYSAAKFLLNKANYRNRGITLCLAYVLSILLFATLATIGYVSHIDKTLLQIVGWFLIILGSFFFIKNHHHRDLLQERFPLICLIAMTVLSLAFIGLQFNGSYTYIPDPKPLPDRDYQTLNVKVLNVAQTPANDNYIPYRQAQFFVNNSNPGRDSFIGEWGVHFFQRTPLMGAVTANYFLLFQDHPPIDYTWSQASLDEDYTYLKFQIIAQVLNSIFILSAYYLIKKLFNTKTALITTVFLVTSHFFLYNSFFTWPKSFVAFFILFAWLLLLEKRKSLTVIASVTSGAAYLSHDLALIYVGATILLLMSTKRFKDSLIFGLGTLVFVIPWMFISTFTYRKPSSFIYYPFSIHGLPQPGTGAEIMREFFHTSPFKILLIRLDTFFYLMTPYQLLRPEGQTLLSRIWAMSLYTIPGSVGLGLFFPAMFRLFKSMKNKMTLIILIFAPIILTTLIIGWDNSRAIASLHFAQAIVVLLTAVGVYQLTLAKNRLWLIAVYCLSIAQLIFLIMYSYNFKTLPWLSNQGDVLILIVIAALEVAGGWIIYRAQYDYKLRWIHPKS